MFQCIQIILYTKKDVDAWYNQMNKRSDLDHSLPDYI